LRLSSLRFAYLNLIYRILFRKIDLVASSEHLEHVAETDFSHIAPFLKTVTFVAPTDSWALTLEGFREVIPAQAIQRYAADHEIRGGMKFNTYELEGHQKFIEQHWNGKGITPLSKDRIRAGSEQYRRQALAARNLLCGEELRATWTSVLRKLANVHNVCFVTPRYEKPEGSRLPNSSDYIVRSHHRDRTHPDESCRIVIAPVGDALFAAGIACLAEANAKVQDLEVACAMTGEVEWETLAGWEDLDLSQMWRFKFQPKVQSFGEDLDLLEGENAITAWAAIAVAAVLKKCRENLEEFSYDGCCPMQWPGDEVIDLPRLRYLSLDRGSIRPRNLRAWIATMPLLEDLRLHKTGLCGDVHHGWKYIFDAVRDHPTRMKIWFDRIITNGAPAFSLVYHTDDFQRVLEQEEHQDPWEDITRSLSLYLSGKIEYNRSLSMWLQDD